MSMTSLNHAAHAMSRRLVWETRRRARLAYWRMGRLGLLAVACAGIVLLALGILAHQHALRTELAERLAQERLFLSQGEQPIASNGTDARAKLQRFDAFLPAAGDIPLVLSQVLKAAQDEGLELARGDYAASLDPAGRFMRYRMTLPVVGRPEAIHKFMLAALKAHRSLALQSVVFRRERSNDQTVEASVQWVLFTHAPDAKAEGQTSEGGPP